MASYSEYMKSRKEKDLAFFFGETKKMTNKYFSFKRVVDDDNIIIITNNIKTIKGSFVMMVDNNKVIYLKDWQVRPIHNYGADINAYAVKLNRKYWKVYTFKSDFEDMAFEKEETFDDLMAVAIEQDEENMPVALGHMG